MKNQNKFLLYKNINENKKNNLYYYCEGNWEDSNKPIKYGKMLNKNENNSLNRFKKNNIIKNNKIISNSINNKIKKIIQLIIISIKIIKIIIIY